MHLSGLHLLLTYQCVLQCDHCFTWGSPWQKGVMSLTTIRHILDQACELGTITTIYFEGGEPFLYYSTLLQGVQEAARLGFKTGIVTNAFWAISEEDGIAALAPFAGLVQNLTISSDLFHWDEANSRRARNGIAAANRFGIPVGTISIAQPDRVIPSDIAGQIPLGQSQVMYRGRAAVKLANLLPGLPWETFTACPHENLIEPGRVHVDSFGNVHICQGISLGNLHQVSLKEICASYRPGDHPITGPLVSGGPAELVRRYGLPREEDYVDACNLCYSARVALRARFPEVLGPDQIYGVF